MEPRSDDDALVALLDTVVDEGVVVDADLVVAVGDVPLVGVRLRAALAGMSTMTEHGHFEGWDRIWRAEGAVDAEGVADDRSTESDGASPESSDRSPEKL